MIRFKDRAIVEERPDHVHVSLWWERTEEGAQWSCRADTSSGRHPRGRRSRRGPAWFPLAPAAADAVPAAEGVAARAALEDDVVVAVGDGAPLPHSPDITREQEAAHHVAQIARRSNSVFVRRPERGLRSADVLAVTQLEGIGALAARSLAWVASPASAYVATAGRAAAARRGPGFDRREAAPAS
jgi:hypothetical protein